MTEAHGEASLDVRPSGSVRGPLAVFLLAVLLAAIAWAVVVSRREAPLRTEMAVHDNLVDAFRDGERIAETRVLNPGQDRGMRHTVGAELRRFEQAVGMLPRPSGEPPFAWLVGAEPWIDLDVLVPRDRTLTLRLAKGVEARDQFVTPIFEGHELERRRLPRDGRMLPLEYEIPAEWQRRGRNRLVLRFDTTEVRQLSDQPAPLAFSGILSSVRFLAEGDDGSARPVPRAGVYLEDGPGGTRRRVVIPAASTTRAATELPEGERVLLRLQLDRVDVPLEITLLTDDRFRHPLGVFGPDTSVPVEVELDVSPWAGRAAVVEAWAQGEAGDGEVHLSQVHVLLPEDERKAWLLARGHGGGWVGAGQRRATEGDDAALAEHVPAPPRRQIKGLGNDSTPLGQVDARPERPSVLLIVLDTLARRAVGSFGIARGSTPNLDGLAARGLAVPDTVAPASYTLASMGSLLTGLEPPRHGVELVAGADGVLRLADDTPRLAATLADAGWRTAAFVTNPNAAGRHGYDAGFEHFEELFADPELWDEGVDGAHLPMRLGAFLEEVGDDPYFAWVHVFEPHAPYAAPDDLRERFVQPYDGEAAGTREYLDAVKAGEARPDPVDWRHLDQLYTARVAQADRVLGALIDTLALAERTDDTLIVVTSDHGESLGEHDAIEHGDLVYGHQVDVPLVFAAPWLPRGRLFGPASLVDVAPTVLGQLGLDAPPAMRGVDLTSAVPDAERPRLTRSASLWPVYGWHRGDWKLVADTATGALQLFDLKADPHEFNDLSRQRPARRLLMLRELIAALSDVEAEQSGADLIGGDASTSNQISELGYAEGGVPDAEDTPLLRLRGLCRRL